MNPNSLKILKTIAKNGELSLKEAAELSGKASEGHTNQYPLATLISEEFLGVTAPFPMMEGTEKMPEFMGATFLHMNRLPKNKEEKVEYNGITQSGSSFENEKIFIRAKGALYLDELKQRKNDRIIHFLIGFFTAILSTFLANSIN